MNATKTALAFVASLVLPDGRRWGEVAVPWQWQFAMAFLNPHAQTPFYFITRPRGGSKTFDLAACVLAIMVGQAPRGARLYAVAADREQGQLVRQAIQDFALHTPGLAGLLIITQNRVEIRETGVTLDILAADAPGSWGLRPYLIVIDEVAQWPQNRGSQEMLESMLSAVVKINSCRLAVATTAGDPTHYSFTLLQHARNSSRWSVFEVLGPLEWRTEEELEDQRAILLEPAFRRLHLNEWTEAQDSLTTLDDLRACVTHTGPLPPQRGVRYLIAADIGIRIDPAVAVVCHLQREVPINPSAIAGQRIVVDLVKRWQPTETSPVSLPEVREWILSASRNYNRADVIFDPYQAELLAQELESRDVKVEKYVFNQASIHRLAQTLYLAVKDRVLALPDDPELLDELARIRIIEAGPNSLRLDHDHNQHDDQAIAIALAATTLQQQRVSEGPRLRGLWAPYPTPPRVMSARLH